MANLPFIIDKIVSNKAIICDKTRNKTPPKLVLKYRHLSEW